MNDTQDHDNTLPEFWQDSEGNDRAHLFNFYRFCQRVEQLSPGKAPLGSTFSPQQDAVRFRPHPGMGFPVSTLKAVETDPDHPDRPPTVRTTFMGLYGVDSPLPTSYLDDIAQRRDGHEALEAFLDIFNHRMMTQFYRIWRKHNYPASFEAGGSDKISRSLMALTGITHGPAPTSRLLALLQPLMRTTRTAEGLVSVIKTQAPLTQVTITPHEVTVMPTGSHQVRFSPNQPQRLGEHLILGSHTEEVNYRIGVALYTEDPAEANGWLPGGQLREDVFMLLGVYLGCDYDASLKLTIPMSLAPVPRLGDPFLLSGYNVVLGLREDNLDEMPEQVTMSLGRVRDKHAGTGKKGHKAG